MAEGNVASETGGQQHLMSWLQYPLQVRRVTLSQWQLLSELVEGYSPGDRSILSCDLEQSKQRKYICWSSHGRNLHIMLPALVWDMVYALRPRTLYSYKSLDVRMPPSVRVRLPLNATTNFGYEDEILGWRISLKF